MVTGVATFRAIGVQPLRNQAAHFRATYHGQCQAVAQAVASRQPVLAAWKQSGQSLAAACRLRAGRRRGDGLTVYANWGAEVQFSPAKVLERHPAATQLHRVLVDLGSLSEGYTKPGQFIQVKVGDCKPGFFAIASAPDANNAGVVELLIKDQGGAAELLCQAKPGDEVMVSPVMGKGFPMDRAPSASHPTLLMFATGSGISPLKALLECEEALSGAQRRDVRLYYGARTADHMAYRDRVAEWEKAGVKVVPVFSGEGQGYVQDALAKADDIQDWSGVAAVLCGQKGMCEAVTEYLTSKGVAKEQILLNF